MKKSLIIAIGIFVVLIPLGLIIAFISPSGAMCCTEMACPCNGV